MKVITQDVSNIPGTNCYLDETAKMHIKNEYSRFDCRGIHLLGSGNYHYLSYLWLEKIKEKFYLLIFDNHPDMQKPAFGDILSCGSWVKAAAEDFPNLSGIYICGAALSHIEEEGPYPENVSFIKDTSEVKKDYPLYISIDKDVLSVEYAKTDWDQGEMSLDTLCDNLEKLKGEKILGIDICGDTKSEPNGSDINSKTNEILIPHCLSLLERSPLS